ncbi:four helix bundle protein [Anaerolineae bacterium CFX7]|nr:four helix bundle protein [Anaerolineae bacterium CFX7]RIK16304.1 MAG: four helix bundle protein [Chloroflexota bacterium]
MSDYRNLKVWYQTLDFVARVYEITSEFPAREQYGLTSQIRRAATSIALNIAEGATSGYNSEYARFLRIAIRSANEVSAGFEIAKRLKFCSSEDAQSQINAADHIAAMLQALIKSLGKVSENQELYDATSFPQEHLEIIDE